MPAEAAPANGDAHDAGPAMAEEGVSVTVTDLVDANTFYVQVRPRYQSSNLHTKTCLDLPC